jgi:hypothetical protein
MPDVFAQIKPWHEDDKENRHDLGLQTNKDAVWIKVKIWNMITHE